MSDRSPQAKVQVRRYDPKDVVVKINGIEVTGFSGDFYIDHFPEDYPPREYRASGSFTVWWSRYWYKREISRRRRRNKSKLFP